MKWPFALTLMFATCLPATTNAARYDFGVFLDGKRIGEHTFELERIAPDRQRVRSTARFDVKVLRIPVFRYRHSAEEVWKDGCLQSITSETTVNGKRSALEGSRQSQAFDIAVTKGDETESVKLPACVSTFAYWDAETLLEQERLLNSQTGAYEPVTFDVTDPDRVKINGKQFVIDLDYAADRWRGLSTLRDGRKLEYRLECPLEAGAGTPL